jgi:predicted DNA-binding antitoxin AbrB/MazE fold protein
LRDLEQSAMSIVIDATYEDGVLKPDTPLPLAEHEKVRVTVEQRPAAPEHVPTANGPSLGERIAAMARELPPEVIESWPVDGASQHDHYIYGTPKRPE